MRLATRPAVSRANIKATRNVLFWRRAHRSDLGRVETVHALSCFLVFKMGKNTTPRPTMCNGGASKSKSVEALRLSTVRSVGASASTGTGTWDNRRRPDCMAGVGGLELRNVDANYPFERSHRFAGIQPNSGFGDYSRLSCGAGDTQLRPGVLRNTHGRWSA